MERQDVVFLLVWVGGWEGWIGLIGPLGGRSVGLSVGWLVGWLVGWWLVVVLDG